MLLTAIGTALLWYFRKSKAALLLLAFSFLLFGLARSQQSETQAVLAENHISKLIIEKSDAVIVGTLSKLVEQAAERSRAEVEVAFLLWDESKTFTKSTGNVLLSLQGPWPNHIVPGDALAVRCLLKPPGAVNTPGTFDYARFLARKSIYLTGSVRSPLLIQPALLPAEPSHSWFDQFYFFIQRQRTHISRRIDEALPPRSAGLYRALLIGDRSGIDNQTAEAFKSAGVYHILAISGMHMALLALFIYHLIFWLLRRSQKLMLSTNVRKWAMVFTIVPLLIYTFLAGAQPPVVRSFIMTFFVMIALVTNRLKSSPSILAAAGLCILVYDPRALQGASFQLSFAAVAAIVLLGPGLLQFGNRFTSRLHLPGLARRLILGPLTIGAITIIATLGTMPLLLHHFNRLSLVSLPANLIVEPLICLWSLPAGFIAIPLLTISAEAAKPLLLAGSWSLSVAVETSLWLSSLRYSQLWLPSPEPYLIVIYYLLLIFSWLPGLAKVNRSIRVVAGITVILVFFLPATPFLQAFRQETSISFIDVGQGSATLIEYAGGRNVLVDGGARSAPGYDCGTRIIAPYLWHRKIARLDDIVVTHDDADHYNGIAAIIQRFRPRRLWLPHRDSAKPGFKSLMSIAAQTEVAVLVPEASSPAGEEAIQLSFIGGKSEQSSAQRKTSNKVTAEDDRGLVVRIEADGLTALLPGDIGWARELELVEGGQKLRADVLLSPHHGSSTSNSEQFLAAVAPRYMVVSSGDQTGRLFPSPQTRQTAQRLGIKILSTEEDGTIMMVSRTNAKEGSSQRHAAEYSSDYEIVTYRR